MADSCIKTTNLENKSSGNTISLDDIEDLLNDSGKGWNYKNVNDDSDIVANDFCKVDTSGGVVKLTLPDSPEDNDMLVVWDITGSFNSNNCNVDGNGNKIMGDDTIDLDVDNKEYHIIYDDNSSEWRVS